MIAARGLLARAGLAAAAAVVGTVFALPLLWLVLAPFDRTPTLAVAPPEPTLGNFARVFDNPFAGSSLLNSAVMSLAAGLLVVATGALAAYAVSRLAVPGRSALLAVLVLFSSVVSGTAAMVPIFRLVFRLGLIDTRLGVVLVLTGGLLPTAIFILKDYVDSLPASYDESARVFGASTWRLLIDLVVPLMRPALAVIFVWTVVQVWGDFLTPFILLRGQEAAPAAVVMYSFYNEVGLPDLRLVSAFSLLYTIPVVVLYWVVNSRYGFRFHGGIKA